MAHEILIIDDEPDNRMVIAGTLEDVGYDTREAGNAQQGLDALAQKLPSLILLDIWLQGSHLDGMQLLEIIQEQYADVPVIMISGHGTIETAVSAIRIGAYDFLQKPFDADRLLITAKRAIEAAELRKENHQLKSHVQQDDQLVGSSSSLNLVRQSIEKLATIQSRIVISGESGSGKELAARLIHMQSPRKTSPFIIVKCMTEAQQLSEELFGCEQKGQAPQYGLLDKANGGTILLNEVSDLPMDVQGKIVRLLQEQSFSRVGNSRKYKIDIRFIGTTSRDLKQEIADGNLREDLYYRLNVVPLEMPSLKERREDIIELIHYFADLKRKSGEILEFRLGTDAVTTLQTYDWPGNIRQLKNFVDWLHIMAPTLQQGEDALGEDGQGEIKSHMLPPEIQNKGTKLLRKNWLDDILTQNFREARDNFEREYLIAQLARHDGHISRTADSISMERTTLHRKIKSLGVKVREKKESPASVKSEGNGKIEANS